MAKLPVCPICHNDCEDFLRFERARLAKENEKLKEMVARYVDMHAVKDSGENGQSISRAEFSDNLWDFVKSSESI